MSDPVQGQDVQQAGDAEGFLTRFRAFLETEETNGVPGNMVLSLALTVLASAYRESGAGRNKWRSFTVACFDALG